jgi:hypothetical protein
MIAWFRVGPSTIPLALPVSMTSVFIQFFKIVFSF